MAERIRFRPPPEPAHVSLVRNYEDLVGILTHIRDKAQGEIDRAFDRVSSQIGFVVATTVPVTLEVEEGGNVKELALRGEHLQGTLFEKELLPSLTKILGEGHVPKVRGTVSKGTYDFYLLWFDALKLKLGSSQFRPPPEPAHFRLAAELARFRPPPEPAHYAHGPYAAPELAQSYLARIRVHPEPAHWFNPAVLISEAEQVLIVALDEVYPELKLVERINAARRGQEVMLNPQPLPPRSLAEAMAKPSPDPWRAIQAVLDRVIATEPDPHPWRALQAALNNVVAMAPQPQPWRARMLQEILEVIQRYGPRPEPWFAGEE